MSTEFMKKKIRTLFYRFDVNMSGHIEEHDFQRWSENLISLGNLNTDESNLLMYSIKTLWHTYFAPADTDNDGNITCDELIDFIINALNDESKKNAITKTIPLIFDAIDCDKDSKITKKEFSNYYQSLKIKDDKVINQLFILMDTNSDGTISRDEFISFGNNFFLNNDPSDPARLFFGPLMD